ncbi:MAG: stage II sporulation protein P [Christensenellaceae bacterium]|jgi:stage II sporulation protein P|nr:stage II sporulation protein P [Christensenellaceae bacterium]
MIRIKVFRASQLLYGAAVVLLCLLLLGLGLSFLWGGNGSQTPATSPPRIGEQASPAPAAEEDDVEIGDRYAAGTENVSAAAFAAQDLVRPAERFSAWLVNVDFLDPISVLSYQFPSIAGEETLPVTAESDEHLPDTADETERIRVEIERIEKSGESYQAPVKEDGKPLRVLIYHTHSYEAYAQNADEPYVETSQWRTKDQNHNIMRVGSELAQLLEGYGIEVVHDLTEHEPPKLGTAYTRSLKTLEGYAERGETFDMMIDLHRDAASVRNTKMATVSAGGLPAARLMVLIGNGERGFAIMPNWSENYKFGQALTSILNEQTPGIARDVMVKTGRYNQHMSESALLIEVGHNLNTLEEAIRSMEPLAKAIYTLLSGGQTEEGA